MTELQGWLDRFDALRVRGPFDYPRHHHHDGGRHGLHVVLGAIVHGDEVGSLPAIVGLLDRLLHDQLRYGGKLTVFLGNPEASLAGRRFLESDLNRVFVDDPPNDHEGRRAQELRPILGAADVFLDLHQTILPTDRPFYIFPWSVPGWQWARAIGGAQTWVTRPPTQSFSPGTCCADEYVRLRGLPGLTLELGHRGFCDQAAARATSAIDRLLAVADHVGTGVETLAGAATHAPDLDFVETRWRCPFDDPTLRLRPGLTNFAPVSAGEVLTAPGSPERIAPVSGLVLFPKYPDYTPDGRAVEPRPGEIVRIVAPLTEHPAVAWEPAS